MRRTVVCTIAAALLAAVPLGAQVDVLVNADGSRHTAVRPRGGVGLKYDIVFLGDGFTISEQSAFNAKVDEAVAALEGMAPYSERSCAFNVWRVNVVSQESGIDHPADGVFVDTELDTRFGNPANGEAERCITTGSPGLCYQAAGYAPDADAVFVLVNDTEWGGCALSNGLVLSSIAGGFTGIVTHELGHKIASLADEYDCYVCDGSDSDRSYTGPEPWRVNLTAQTARLQIPWNDLIAPTTALPTTLNVPPGVVGLWEGGGYYAFDIYRPQRFCHMLSTGQGFCAVCARELRQVLATHCTLCELTPFHPVCVAGDLVFQVDELWHFDQAWRWKLPFCPLCPICLSCPFERAFFEDVVFTVAGAPEGFALHVTDERGEVVAKGFASDQGLQVGFRARRDTGYAFVLESRGEPTGERLALRSRLFRDGFEQRLP